MPPLLGVGSRRQATDDRLEHRSPGANRCPDGRDGSASSAQSAAAAHLARVAPPSRIAQVTDCYLKSSALQEQLEDGRGRPPAERDPETELGDGLVRGRATAKRMNEDARPLVAGAREPKPLSQGADAAVRLGDRVARVVETLHR